MKRAMLGWVLLLCAACGDDDGDDGSVDLGPGPDTGARCRTDAECDDGVFCNGVERCFPGGMMRDERDCIPGDDPCGATDGCDEAAAMCVPCVDADDDGACASVDCDDADPARFPGNTEVCDALNVDEDCDPTTFGDRDADGDGAVDAACCNEETGAPVCGDDCDDGNELRAPGKPEVCDGLDNDCDVSIDEEITGSFRPDFDGDGFGDRDAEPLRACYPTLARRRTAVDCDDTDPRVFPGAGEICGNGVDENCNGNVDEGCSCTGTETRSGSCPLPGRCRDADEVCVDGTFECAATPGPIDETCNGVDDDCDGLVDEGVSIVCFVDADDDGWPTWGADVAAACADDARAVVGGCPDGFTDRVPAGPADCNDGDPAVSPDGEEVCGNLRDDDCNLAVDDGCD